MISLLKKDLQLLLSKKDFHTQFPFTSWPENGRSLELHPIWKRRHFSLYNLDLRADGFRCNGKLSETQVTVDQKNREGEWENGAPKYPCNI